MPDPPANTQWFQRPDGTSFGVISRSGRIVTPEQAEQVYAKLFIAAAIRNASVSVPPADTSREWQLLTIVPSVTLLCFLGYLAARRRLHRWFVQRKGTVFMIPSRSRVIAAALVVAALMTLFPPFFYSQGRSGNGVVYYGCLLLSQEGGLDMERLQMQYIIVGLLAGAVVLVSADRAKRA